MTNVSSLPDVVDVLARLRARHPLAHCLTNQVVKNFTANLILAVRATSAKVEHPLEAIVMEAAILRMAAKQSIRPGTFQIALLGSQDRLDDELLLNRARIDP